ncbi:hypothetical protein ACSTLG_00310, partial [Vibrio parahaemolyticus]
MSSTRWHYGTTISEADMMAHIDRTYTSQKPHVPYPLDPKKYKAWFESCSQEVQDALLGVGQGWHDMELRRLNKL